MFNLKSKLGIQNKLFIFKNKGDQHYRMVVPTSYQTIMLLHNPDEVWKGHPGIKATYETWKQFAYWANLYKDFQNYVKTSTASHKFQPTKPQFRASLQLKEGCQPWTDLQVDWIGPVPQSNQLNKYLLIVTCLFTKWVECFAAPHDNDVTTACLLVNNIFTRWGLSLRTESDRRSNFTSEVMFHL